jgi:hypothetical protein
MPSPVVNIWLEEDPAAGLIVRVFPDPVHVTPVL